ncbi:MAG: HAMP domain-containing histidine kinase [Marinobacter sp.]|uniref:HAMP domain-containing sensor histidine kinase n=2 Tax=Marinobacter TaxID=2742 RepID=UPI001B655959|nr:HAMP domain-containing sensor histidine kinase [Marinobacter sp.]MBQ0813363.1 HAMP domain-containing histidine kinase [Marinobacter sp.]|tara:strand:+ start:810 stop:2099 length:1290 start_codon:yes stop_codon:yes gene_type:complete
MKSSLTKRLARTLFFLIAVTTATSMFIVELFVNDVEDTILGLELKADAEYFTKQLQQGTFQPIKTAQLEAVFLPEGEADLVLPEHFRSRSLPFSQEIEIGETTLLIVGEQLEQPDGKLFLAQDITIMENRESLVQLALVGVAGFMLLVGFFIARTGAQYMVRPFRKLTHEVMNTSPGSSMRQIDTDYRDQEFCNIAEAFNRFLSALEHHIEREKSFVKLASHELRTPLAVMSGALNVLEQRQSLSAADQKTLARIRRAMQTMRDDTEVLLELARSEASESDARTIVLQEVVQNTIDDLEHGHPDHAGRITVYNNSPGLRVTTHPALVRMLMRNLLQNALRHTRAEVEVRMIENRISVRDFGAGLPINVTEHLGAVGAPSAITSATGESSNTTFGLLIVRLVCERLGWDLEIAQSDSDGTEFLIHVHNLV